MNEIEEEETELFIGALNSSKKRSHRKQTNRDDKQWKEVLKINGQKFTFRLDTGADCNVLPLSAFNHLAPNSALQKSGFQLVT